MRTCSDRRDKLARCLGARWLGYSSAFFGSEAGAKARPKDLLWDPSAEQVGALHERPQPLRPPGEVYEGGPEGFGGEFVVGRRRVGCSEHIAHGSTAVIEQQVGTLVADDGQLQAVGSVGWKEHDMAPVGRDAGARNATSREARIRYGGDDDAEARSESLEEQVAVEAATTESKLAQERPGLEQRVHASGLRCPAIR